MSINAVMNFVQQVHRDPELRESFLKTSNSEEATKLANSAGYEFSSQHMHDAFEIIAMKNTEYAPITFTDYVPSGLLTKARPESEAVRLQDEKTMSDEAVKTLMSEGVSRSKAKTEVADYINGAIQAGKNTWEANQIAAGHFGLNAALRSGKIDKLEKQSQQTMLKYYGTPELYLPKGFIQSHLQKQMSRYIAKGDSVDVAFNKALDDTKKWFEHKTDHNKFLPKTLDKGIMEHYKNVKNIGDDAPNDSIPQFVSSTMLNIKKPSSAEAQHSDEKKMFDAAVTALVNDGHSKPAAEAEVKKSIKQQEQGGQDSWDATKFALEDINKKLIKKYRQEVNNAADKLLKTEMHSLTGDPYSFPTQTTLAMALTLKKAVRKYESEGMTPLQAVHASKKDLNKWVAKENHTMKMAAHWKNMASYGSGGPGSLISFAWALLNVLDLA